MCMRFVLVNTTHPGNIGGCARAMKNMNFSEMYLVNPSHFPDEQATKRASGADDILDRAVVVKTLDEAIANCHLVVGTSSRSRSLTIPLITPRECAQLAQDSIKQNHRIAVVFGQERTGLTNEELSLCHYHLSIPCNEDFPSLNLAAAVQIIAYELNLTVNSAGSSSQAQTERVSASDMQRFYEHLEQTLIDIDFLDPENPRQLMRKLKRLFNRAAIEQNEMNILRGILSGIKKQV